jgi:hypothetical protein
MSVAMLLFGSVLAPLALAEEPRSPRSRFQPSLFQFLA